MSEREEIFEIVDEFNNIVGKAPRSECHGNPALIHRTARVIVFHPEGEMLLQKRSNTKDIQPGKWDTAVGGHLEQGEEFIDATLREMEEELGIKANQKLEFLFDSSIRNEIESENIRVFSVISEGPFDFNRDEIDEVRFWSLEEIKNRGFFEDFTPNLVKEMKKLGWIREK
jgi:isopentenyldiphosphate isomerase